MQASDIAVCNHVPFELTAEAVHEVAEVVLRSGLTVRSVNADVGDLKWPLDADGVASRQEHVQRLVELCQAIGSTGLMLPNGAQQHEPIVSLDEDLTWLNLVRTGRVVDCVDQGPGLVVEGCAGAQDVAAGLDGDASVGPQGVDDLLDRPAGLVLEPVAHGERGHHDG